MGENRISNQDEFDKNLRALCRRFPELPAAFDVSVLNPQKYPEHQVILDCIAEAKRKGEVN